MATINFLYRSTKEKGFLTVRLLYSTKENNYVFGAKTKLEVTKSYWTKSHNITLRDAEKLRLQTEIKNELGKIENYILSNFSKCSSDTITKEWLETKVENYYNPKQISEDIPTELTKYFDYYIELKKHELSKTLKQKYLAIKQKIIKLENLYHKSYKIKDVDEKFLNEFVDYYKSNNYSQNYTQKEFANIKTVCRHARFSGLETSPQLDSLSIDTEKVENTYLTFDELKTIENINPSKLTPSLANARDWLIISCYCAQRVSDFKRLTPEMIRIEAGTSLLEFTQVKSRKIMTIPLHPKIIEIVKKRNGMFPYQISDQRYNDFIKKVCKIAGLTQIITGSKQIGKRKVTGQYPKYELVTSHIGRRSFATNFYGTVPTSLLIGTTGHSSEAMFLKYIGKSNKDLAIELSKYF
jgi:integrase